MSKSIKEISENYMEYLSGLSNSDDSALDQELFLNFL